MRIASAQFWDEGEESGWFKVKTGVKQGDVMSGFIFLIVIDKIMKNVTEKNNTGNQMEIHGGTR